MSKWGTWRMVLGLLALAALLTACGGGGTAGGSSETPAAVTLIGQVTGSGGLAEVSVSAGGKETRTDADGYYRLEDVPVPAAGPLQVDFSKAGYAPQQRLIPVVAGATHTVNAKLLAYQTTENVDGAAGGSIQTPDGSEVEFPAGSLPSGDVTVKMAVADPTTEEGRAVFPGDFMGRDSSDPEPATPLESVVFTEVSLTDANGDPITQLDENNPATVRLRLPDSLQGQYSAGDTIAWWSYDEQSGTWVREDADPTTSEMDDATVVEVNGELYVEAKVTHFTWWNADHPIDEHACLCVTVVDGDGNPLSGVLVYAEGVTYNGISTPRLTDAQGRACVTVKRSTASSTEQVKIYVEQGGVRFYYQQNGDEVIDTPTQQGSTIDDSGQCVELGDLVVSFDGRIEGTVYDRDGNPVSGFTFYTNFGTTITTGSDGRYGVDAPAGQTVSLFYPGWFSDPVTVADSGVTTHDIDLPNRSPSISRVDRNPAGRIDNGAALQLAVVAGDPDGDALTYQWTATTGSFSNATTAQTTWTAPVAGSGTATLTVTVSDDRGATASQSLTVLWGSQTVSTQLRLQFYHGQFDREPAAGVMVALEKSDGTVATLTSDSNGVVDFGDIGLDHATYTIAWEGPGGDLIPSSVRSRVQGSGIFPRNLRTLVNVPVGDTTYYLDQDLGLFSLYGFETGLAYDYQTLLANCDTPVRSLTVNVSVAPSLEEGGGITNIGLLPVSPYDLSDVPASFSVDICPAMLESDGQLSLLAVGLDATGRLVGYGQLIDQNPDSLDDPVEIVIDQPTDELTWRVTGTTVLPPSLLSVTAWRQGVPYTGILDDTDGNFLDASGSNGFPAGFPFDHYWLEEAFFEGNNATLLTQARRFDVFTSEVVFEKPAFDLSGNISNTGVVTWDDVSGTSKDFYRLSSLWGSSTSWTITVPPDITTVSLEDLPIPEGAADWLDPAQISTSLSALTLEAVDYDSTQGLDEVWSILMNGQPMHAYSFRRDSGWSSLWTGF